MHLEKFHYHDLCPIALQSIRQCQNVVKFILAHAHEKWAFSVQML